MSFLISLISGWNLIEWKRNRFPNILVSRLFLNLRSFQNPRYGLSSNDVQLPTPSFAQNRPNGFLGNIGEPLDYDQWDDFLDEEGINEGDVESNSELKRVRDPLMTLVPVVSTRPEILTR